jgi:hypothetical protein
MAVKRCKEAFAYWTDGVPRVIHEGDLVDEADDAYRDHKSLFENIRASNVSGHVERATAAPGEKRRLRPKD